jgi:hypothetical protein
VQWALLFTGEEAEPFPFWEVRLRFILARGVTKVAS